MKLIQCQRLLNRFFLLCFVWWGAWSYSKLILIAAGEHYSLLPATQEPASANTKLFVVFVSKWKTSLNSSAWASDARSYGKTFLLMFRNSFRWKVLVKKLFPQNTTAPGCYFMHSSRNSLKHLPSSCSRCFRININKQLFFPASIPPSETPSRR